MKKPSRSERPMSTSTVAVASIGGQERTSRPMAADASFSFSVASSPALADGVRHAVGQVVVEQLERHRLEGLGGGGHLFEDVDAVAVLVDHALQAPDLALHPPQAFLEGLLVVDVARSHGAPILVPNTPIGYLDGSGRASTSGP